MDKLTLRPISEAAEQEMKSWTWCMVQRKVRKEANRKSICKKKHYAGPQLTFFFNLQQQQQQTLNKKICGVLK